MAFISRRSAAVLAASAVLLVAPAYVRAYSLGGISDAPTLLLGDKAVVSQGAYWINLPYTDVHIIHIAHPKRGDLVQILRPDKPLRVFKRVIGLPGETVEVRENHVVINGHELPLKRLSSGDFSWVPERNRMADAVYDEDGHWVAFSTGVGENRNTPALQLKADEYFLMGDNRDVSLDCRVWGPLKEDAILGKVIWIMPTGPRKKKR